MAVYLFDQYKLAYPKRQVNFLSRFEGVPKHLHEMSVSEINQYIASLEKFAPSTVARFRIEFKLYYDYLSAKGIAVDTQTYQKIDFPTSSKSFLIFSSHDVIEQWNILLKAMEKYSITKNQTFIPETYWVCLVADILGFYGLSASEILDISYIDVTASGIKGYEHIPFTSEDIEVLLKYKALSTLNGRQLTGTSYIRSTLSKPPTADYITIATRKGDIVPEDYKYLRENLRLTNVQYLGIFNRIYEYELKNNVRAEFSKNPQWFLDFLDTNSSSKIVRVKKEYIEYREERKMHDAVAENTVAQVTQEVDSKPVQTVRQRIAFEEDEFIQLTREVGNLRREMQDIDSRLQSILSKLEHYCKS